MSPVTKISIRKLKSNKVRSAVSAISVLFSMLLISFFAAFEFEVLMYNNPEYEALPFTEFMAKVSVYINISIAVLLIITILTVRTHCVIRNEENKQILGVLTSIGASRAQKTRLILTDILVLHLPSVFIGVITGVLSGATVGIKFNGLSYSVADDLTALLLFMLLITLFSIVLILLCSFLPAIGMKRTAIIQSVKKQNSEAAEQTHGYRKSNTYRSQKLMKRLAQKSIDYYARTYNMIAITFASSAVYPILAVMLFCNIANESFVADDNPYDGVDTIASTSEIVGGILAFLSCCFLVLTCIGIIQAVLMSRIQITARKRSAQAYLAIGMTADDVKKLIGMELRGVGMRTLVILIFAVMILNTCFLLAGN